MINWEELKHIHVIRKFEEILAQWFNTDIFFVDERGIIRNYDPAEKHKEFKNPYSTAFIGQEKSRGILFRALADANEKARQKDSSHLVVPGPAGVENFLVSRISSDNEFLGTVIAYSFIEKETTQSTTNRSKNTIEHHGLDWHPFEAAANRLRALSEPQLKYFHELVDLVAQEIVTFHTEITKREERIRPH